MAFAMKTKLVSNAIIQEALDSAQEELLAAIAAGDYCGEGTIWVPEWNECIAIPTCFGDSGQRRKPRNGGLIAVAFGIQHRLPIGVWLHGPNG